MGISAGRLYADIVPRIAAGFSRDLAGQISTPATRAGSRAGQDAGRRFGQRFAASTGIGDRVSRSIGAAFAGTAVLVAVKRLTDAGSDLNETVNKTGLAFGGNAKEILAWAKGSAKNLGLPKQAALEGASGFGLLFSKLGVGAGQTATMSKRMVELAADLGSVHNADPTAIIEAQTAAFRGEYDGLQKFVPAISAATVEQEALRETHKKSAKDLTASEKAQAVYALMLKQTSKEQGDFARTSNEAANKTKINAARVKDLQANLGMMLLPAVTAATNALGDLGTWVERNQGAAKALGVAVVATTGLVVAWSAATKVVTAVQSVAKAAALAWAAGQKVLNFVLAANPIGLVVAAIGLLVVGLVLAYKKSDTFRRIVDGAFRAVKAAGVAMWHGLQTAFTAITGAAKWLADRVVEAARRGFLGPIPWIIANWGRLRDWFSQLPGKIAGFFTSLPGKLRTKAGEAFSALLTRAREKWETIKDWAARLPGSFVSAMGNLGKALVDKFSGAVKRVLEFLGIKSPSRVFERIGHALIAGLAKGIAARMKGIPGLLGRLRTMAFGALGDIGAGFLPSGGGGAGGVVVALGRSMAAQMGWVGAQWEALYQLWQHESGWNPNAQNPTSTAYGIAQFLNSTWAGTGFAKSSDPQVQIAAGLNYIRSGYGSPLQAWSAWLSRSPHWYGEGGLFTRPTVIGVGERGPEAVVPLRRTGRLALEPAGPMVVALDAATIKALGAASAAALHGSVVQMDGQAVGALVVEPQFRDLRRLLRSTGRSSRA